MCRRLLAFVWVLALLSRLATAQSDAFMDAYAGYTSLIEQGSYGEAIPLAHELVRLSEEKFGSEHENTATLLYQLATLYLAENRTKDVEPLFKRALSIYETAVGADHPAVALVLADLAGLYRLQARFADAEGLYRRILRIRERTLGANHPDVSATLNDIAEIHRDQGRYAEAEALYQRSLAIDEASFGPEHPEVATTLNNLALLYEVQGRYGDAEPLHKRALVIKERALGLADPTVASTLINLATVYQRQGRYAEAEQLLSRAISIKENSVGPAHFETAVAVNNLAALHIQQGRDVEAALLYQRALEIFERALGPAHPNVAANLNGMAEIHRRARRFEEAEPRYERALEIQRSVYGPEHFETAITLNNLAVLYRDQGRSADAESVLRSVLQVYERALGHDHPLVAAALTNLAGLCEERSCHPEALDNLRRATSIIRDRAGRGHLQRSGGAVSEQRVVRPGLLQHLRVVHAIAEYDEEHRPSLLAESFEVAQLTRSTTAARAVAGMASRFAAGQDELAGVVRQRQDALALWRSLEEKIIGAVSRPPDERDEEADARLRSEQARLDLLLKDLDGRLLRDFPDYAEIANPQPVSLRESQRLLGAGEALVSFAVSERATFINLVRADDAAMFKVDIGADELRDAVVRLRATLTPEGLFGLKDLLDRGYEAGEAYRLYQRLFAPLEPRLANVRHLLVVPDDALQSLPLGVLLTEAPQGELVDFAGYRNARWLARRYAMTTLPSVSSLRALRRFARTSKARTPFTGFGDPVLEGKPGGQRGIEIGTLFRGVLADVRAVRRLARLPDTADELRAIAETLNAGEDALVLGSEMTEARVRQMDLSDSRVLAFATHGLVAGDIEGTQEPALVFTPPQEASVENDGLLTGSEIARHLRLDADLVILSACNTASPDGTPGAEALSGLAKAFFYAGSRALLVSHWPVASQAAVQLTTRMFEEAAADPGAGMAESLRRSMLAMIDDPERPYLAHPLFWAPFVIVGEGGLAGSKKSP